jgi:hypothetical protein
MNWAVVRGIRVHAVRGCPVCRLASRKAPLSASHVARLLYKLAKAKKIVDRREHMKKVISVRALIIDLLRVSLLASL